MLLELFGVFEVAGQTVLKILPITIVLGVVFAVLTHWSACNPGSPWWRKREIITDVTYWIMIPVGARFVRIEDPGAAVADPGNVFPSPGAGKSGFDLDAVVAVHSREVCATCCDVDGDGTRQINDVVLLLREVLGVRTGRASCGAAPCSTGSCGDANRSDALDIGDAVLCLRTVLDQVSRCTKGACDLDP